MGLEKSEKTFIEGFKEYKQFNLAIEAHRKEDLIKLACGDKRGKYETTTEWKKRRLIVLKAYEYRCGKCGKKTKKLEAHHRFYERYGNESFLDLIPLCEDCHLSAPKSLTRKNKRNKLTILE